MKRIDPRTVELLPGEQQIKDEFEEALSEGLDLHDAADRVLPRFGQRKNNKAPRWITARFVEYLSDGTLTVNYLGFYRDTVKQRQLSQRKSDESGYVSHYVMAVVILVGGLIWGLLAPPAQAWTEPYGGCDEGWQAPHSVGADQCRDHGWIVRHRLVIDPHKVLRYTSLPACYTDDGTGRYCTWRASEQGNHRGYSYYLNRPEHPRYIWEYDPTGSGWRWVNRREDRFLDRHHHHRRWRQCAANRGADDWVVKCANGEGYTSG